MKSVESVRNKKAHTDSTDDTDGTPREACGGVPYRQEIEQIYSKSFKFARFGAICVISREATPFNPMNLLNHPGGVCFKNEKMKK